MASIKHEQSNNPMRPLERPDDDHGDSDDSTDNDENEGFFPQLPRAQRQRLLDERYRFMEDDLSSDDRELLPSEWGKKDGASVKITLEAASRPSRDWRVTGNRPLTEMQFACYSPSGVLLSEFRRMNPPSERARVFVEKVRNRLDSVFEQYEASNLDASGLAEKLLFLSKESERDREWRVRDPLGHLSSEEKRSYHSDLLRTLLWGLARTVRYADWTGQPQGNTLYRLLFTEPNEHDLMLDVPEAIIANDPAVRLDTQQEHHIAQIDQQLSRYNARQDYQARFRSIFRIAG